MEEAPDVAPAAMEVDARPKAEPAKAYELPWVRGRL